MPEKIRLSSAAALACIFMLWTLSCGRDSRVRAASRQSADAVTVAVAKVTAQDLSRDLVLTAEFKPFQEIDVMSKIAGYIKQIYVDVGDRVRQGQMLATLEVPEMADDLARAQAAVEHSSAEVTRAKDEVRRAESAHEIAHLSYSRLSGVAKQRPGLIAQEEIDDARSKDLVSEAQVSAAKSALAAAQEQVRVSKAELGKVQTLLDYTRVTAPFAGVITKRYADTGSMIQAGTASQTQAMPVVRLSENSLLRLILPVPESAVPTVHIGQQVDVRVPSLGRSFRGKVARFEDKLQLSTRTMDTEVDVPNPGLVLVPGMYAEVHLMLAHRYALSVPLTAIDAAEDPSGEAAKGGNTGNVMVVGPSKRLAIRAVSLGMETASRVEVRSGLEEGALVVIGNRASLHAGQVVQPKIVAMAAPQAAQEQP